jgi:hypothetical protein
MSSLYADAYDIVVDFVDVDYAFVAVVAVAYCNKIRLIIFLQIQKIEDNNILHIS